LTNAELSQLYTSMQQALRIPFMNDLNFDFWQFELLDHFLKYGLPSFGLFVVSIVALLIRRFG